MPRPEDEQRLRELFDTYHRDLHAYVLRRAAPGVEAADVVAEVFATAWRRLGSVPNGPHTRPYLFGIARHALANAMRAQLRRERLLALLGRERARPAVVDDYAEVTVEAAACRAALARLRPPDREVLQLTAWEGLGPSELADALGVSANAAQLRLARARRRLRRLLAEAMHQPFVANDNLRGGDSVDA